MANKSLLSLIDQLRTVEAYLKPMADAYKNVRDIRISLEDDAKW